MTIRHKARYVDETKCTGCGLCTEKVPQKKAPNAFNLGLNTRRAIYIPFAQAVPKVATIDPDFCTMLKSGKCGVCAKVCTAGAIDYRAKGPAGGAAIRRHCGGHRLPPHFSGEIRGVRLRSESRCGHLLELERLMNAAGPTGGTLLRPSDGKHPHTLVFVQCGAPRCDDGRGKSYCSKICCMYTAKHAMLCREKYPDTEVYVFYIDVRTPGKGFDEFYRRAVEEYGVHYIKGQVGEGSPSGG